MSDGMKITEVPEAREITKDTPEIAEAQADLNKATFEAPSKVEEGDIQAAEKVQEAFVESVPLAQAAEASPPAAPPKALYPLLKHPGLPRKTWIKVEKEGRLKTRTKLIKKPPLKFSLWQLRSLQHQPSPWKTPERRDE